MEDAAERYYMDHGEFPYDKKADPIKGPDLQNPHDSRGNPFTPDPDKDYYSIDKDKIKDYVDVDDMDDYLIDPETGDVIIIGPGPGQQKPDNTTAPAGPTPLPEEEIDNYIGLYYIPVANADEMDQIRRNGEILTFGKGTKWEGLYEAGLDKNYILVKDIDMSKYSAGTGWKPLGNGYEPFTGRFFGNDHIISNLTVNDPALSDAGLFGYVEIDDPDGLFGHVTIEKAYVVGDEGNSIGELIGYNSIPGLILESYSVSGNTMTYEGYVVPKENV